MKTLDMYERTYKKKPIIVFLIIQLENIAGMQWRSR